MMFQPWIELEEARGRTVKKMTLSFDPDYNCIEVEFTDGTCMAVDVVPAVRIRPQFQDISTGDTKILRSYRTRVSVSGRY